MHKKLAREILMRKKIEKRTALITGSGQNIGRGIAVRLASDGFNIVLNGSRDQSKCDHVLEEILKSGGTATVAMGDIGVEEEAHAIVSKSCETFGRIDVLINNAAIRPTFPFLEMKSSDWDRVMAVNLQSVFWLSRACLPSMLSHGWGRIINFSGMNAQKGYPGKTAVSVSKHAVWGLTKSLSVEYGQSGITANILSPGTFIDDSFALNKKTELKELCGANPTGRLGRSNNIAGLVAYLCSDEGGYVNGQMLQINGGMTVQF